MNLKVNICGLELNNPVMPASGPLTGDLNKMIKLENSGLGAMVTKTISTKAAVVPRPCIVGTNNYILNTELWSEYSPEKWVSEILPAYKEITKIPLIISMGYSPDDLSSLTPKLSQFADAFEISTHYVSEDPDLFKKIIDSIKNYSDKPVFIKFDPTIPSPEKMAQAVQNANGDGIVIMNSLGPVYPLNISEKNSPLGSLNGFGWISGHVIKLLALALIKRVGKSCDLPIIGVGGISTSKDVIEFMMAGATGVQLLSSAMIRGKKVFSDIINNLPNELKKLGYNDINGIIGIAKNSNEEETFIKKTPVINLSKCVKCGLCVRACPYYALTMTDEGIKLNPEECFGCGLCQSRCPTKAISGVF